MDYAIFAQYLTSGLMLGMMYALLAVGFTLFFGVLNVIHFGHGDMFTLGAFVGLAVILSMSAIGMDSSLLQLTGSVLASVVVLAFLGAVVARYLILPLKSAPTLNVLLMTLALGLVIRESVRLFYPEGSNPKPFPALLTDESYALGEYAVRLDNLLMLAGGALTIVCTHMLINKTKLGLAIRAVAQDEETAETMGINYTLVIMATFALGSALAAVAGVMNGLYYQEINFHMGLMLAAIGFSSAIIGGLGNIYGAILGGFLFALLQTLGVVAMPFASAYKDVFAFAVVICIMTWRPTGIIKESVSERV